MKQRRAGNVEKVQLPDNNFYALKTFSVNQPIPDGLLDNVHKRFIKEVRIQSGVRHPNIVPIIAAYLNENPPAYLMPLAVSTLADDIAKDRQLGGAFVSALSDIVAALDELHSISLYHRDLKPQNVLRFVKNSDKGGHFYAVSDFGLISFHESRLSGLTVTGMRKGSDYYTAPEIAREMKHASAQTDIYSLGCILHDIVGTEDRVPCGEIREPGDFSAILLGCTRRDPSRRFKSARAFLDAVLSVDFSSGASESVQSTDFKNALEGGEKLLTQFWDTLADYVENVEEGELGPVFAKLSADRITEIFAVNRLAANRVGLDSHIGYLEGNFPSTIVIRSPTD